MKAILANFTHMAVCVGAIISFSEQASGTVSIENFVSWNDDSGVSLQSTLLPVAEVSYKDPAGQYNHAASTMLVVDGALGGSCRFYFDTQASSPGSQSYIHE